MIFGVSLKQHLLYPMALYVFYIWALAVYNLRVRMAAIKAGEVPGRHFKTYSEPNLPEKVIVTGRHFDNQFQAPLIFLITGVAHLAVGPADIYAVVLAWLFVFSRFAHSYIHLGSNKVLPRAAAYAAGWLFIWLLWTQLVLSHLSAPT